MSRFGSLAAFSFPLRILWKKIDAEKFRSFDSAAIMREEKVSQYFSSGMHAVLIYRLFLRLGKAGLRPKYIIDWYENQVIDKALVSGARKAFPMTKIVGAQMFFHQPNILNLFPSQAEIDATKQVLLHLFFSIP